MIQAKFPNGNLLLVHVPHTGGNWRAAVLEQLGIQYSYLEEFHHKHYLLCHLQYLVDRSESAARFFMPTDTVATFVRDPHSYYETCWRRLNLRSNREWLKRANRGRYTKTWHPFREIFQLWEPSFEAFVYRVTTRLPDWLGHLYDLYCGPQYGEVCDFIGRHETLHEDFWELLDRMGETVSPAQRQELSNMKINETKELAMVPDAYPEVEWTRDMWDRVQRSEQRAIDRFYRQHEHRSKRWYEMSFEKV